MAEEGQILFHTDDGPVDLLKLHAREMSWILENCSANLCIMTPDIAASVSEAGDAFWPEIIATESARLSDLLEDCAHAAERITPHEWPMSDIHSPDLLAVLGRSRSDADA